MAVNKAKRTKAIGALRKAGMSAENAVRHVRYLDLDEPFGPQIEELREDFPTVFDTPDDDKPEDDKGDDKPKPMTTQELKLARLRGEGNPLVHKHKRPERKPTASAAAQEIAAHITPTGRNKPPTQKWIVPVRDINDGHTPLTREPNSSARALAARLKGN
ncbi:hypothetical protein [Streptomyces sp. IBSBF 2950]|uniref:hypothetical protein n=1 Tax=Streptomyces sp. IBSBF 2950 TaxID=2903528 RepID=UPI002FDBF7F7